ncbi:MAG: 6-phosphofructokinase, partial [Desulfatibacillaceae bacterium]|nr:6-phosphofructokinase [Desulfatibacillaceae bacterium]
DDATDFVFESHPEAARQLPKIINNPAQRVKGASSLAPEKEAAHTKKRRIGVVFSGGPAPGGHNVIAGIFDSAKKANPDNEIYGFLMGPDGVIEGEYTPITAELVDRFRNLGGFGMIKTGRTKIDSEQKMELSRKTLMEGGFDSLVIIGGDDSNTNAAFLAQELFDQGVQVIGVPKTIDGDIQVRDATGKVLCAMSFGFHTAARSFAQSVANLCTDSSSDVKYWHICKVMGRVASHLALEVALQTHANITLIGEDLADYVDEARLEAGRKKTGQTDYLAYGMTLRHLSRVVCDCIVRRAAVGKNYGVIVIPEGVLEFINEINHFIIKLNTIIADYNSAHDTIFHNDFVLLEEKLDYLRRLARRSREDPEFTLWNTRDDDLFNDIPSFFQEGLLMERDSHGNFPFSLVETDKVIMGLVTDYLNFLQEQGEYKIGIKRQYFEKTLKRDGLDPQIYGPILFENWPDGEYLLTHRHIISYKTCRQAFEKEDLLEKGKLPESITNIYKKTLPSLKTQTHFYGYDGRGADPTFFDATYTYNLGCTVFALLANGATGQMAAIKNLEHGVEKWEPLGIPIAQLMHLEERQGKLALVIEKSVVDCSSPAFLVVKECRENWLAAHPGEDAFRIPGPIGFTREAAEDLPITLALNGLASPDD